MSLVSKPKQCPQCGSTEFVELARIEACEFAPPSPTFPDGDPPTDRAIYQCQPERHEWER